MYEGMKVTKKHEIKVYRKAKNMEYERRVRNKLGIERELAERIFAH